MKILYEGQFLSVLKRQHKAFCLIDEMQSMIGNAQLERTVKEFCRCLDKNGIPYIGIGTSQLREKLLGMPPRLYDTSKHL